MPEEKRKPATANATDAGDRPRAGREGEADTSAIVRRGQSLSIVVPTFNEQGAVTETAEALLEVARRLGPETEIIFVDDGSTDGTAEALSRLTGIRVIRHRENRGYGAAIKTGIRGARNDWVAMTDADSTYPAGRLPDMFEYLLREKLDMVVGARTGKNARIPLIRRPAKWLLGKLANALCGRTIPDLNSGLRIVSKTALQRFLRLLPDGFSFTSTITLAMLTNGMNVEYLPIEYNARSGKSKIRPLHDTLNFVQLILRAVLWFNPLRIFIPLSLATFASAFAVLFGSWYFLPQPMDVSFGVIFMTGVFILAVGMLADLIDKRM
jgi:glycosyltransferase involved in cell wall biosynthesis